MVTGLGYNTEFDDLAMYEYFCTTFLPSSSASVPPLSTFCCLPFAAPVSRLPAQRHGADRRLVRGRGAVLEEQVHLHANSRIQQAVVEDGRTM